MGLLLYSALYFVVSFIQQIPTEFLFLAQHSACVRGTPEWGSGSGVIFPDSILIRARRP